MGKGSSKGHTPREAKDNLKSTQLLSVIDAISEGPVEGPVDGLKSVLLNSTPVLDSEGNTNISGVTVVFRAGEQEQTPPEGFESSGSETVLGTEVKYDTPITRTITSANIDRLRFTFGVQALVETTSKGDRNPSEVRLLVQIQRNGGWVTEKDITIKGKTTSQYLASVVVDNLPPRPFNIRMRRMTPDSTTDQLQNKTLWSSYTEIIDVKQCYPNTALVGVQVDSEQFGSQQVSRNYHLRGRILQVPSNYNPQTRQYSGIWDGTLKPAYSNNMAWCLWDMLTHPLRVNPEFQDFSLCCYDYLVKCFTLSSQRRRIIGIPIFCTSTFLIFFSVCCFFTLFAAFAHKTVLFCILKDLHKANNVPKVISKSFIVEVSMSDVLRPYRDLFPQIGQRVMIDDSSVVIGDVRLADDVGIWPLVVIRGDVHYVQIGARTNIQDGSMLHVTHKSSYNPAGNPLTIGEDVTVGHKVMLHGCTIGNRVLVGMGSILLDGAIVEDDVMIGAGSLVPQNKRLESGYLYLGSPVKQIRPLSDEEKAGLRYSANNYVKWKDEYMDQGNHTQP